MLGRPLRRAPIVVALLTAACAASAVEGGAGRIERAEYRAEDGSYSLELPLGWRRSGQALTRDGWERQTITFNAGHMDAGPDGKPIDAAAPGFFDALEQELVAQTGVEVLERGPAELDGTTGFRIHFLRASTAVDGTESKREYLTYGALTADRLFVMSYEAPAGEEFARDLPVFEKLVASFRRTASPAGAARQ